jgi:Ca2+-binding EF-hand superfamily protein
MSAPEIFKKYDHNNNGCLEYNEMVDILRQLQHQFGENFAEVAICSALLLVTL